MKKLFIILLPIIFIYLSFLLYHNMINTYTINNVNIDNIIDYYEYNGLYSSDENNIINKDNNSVTFLFVSVLYLTSLFITLDFFIIKYDTIENVSFIPIINSITSILIIYIILLTIIKWFVNYFYLIFNYKYYCELNKIQKKLDPYKEDNWDNDYTNNKYNHFFNKLIDII